MDFDYDGWRRWGEWKNDLKRSRDEKCNHDKYDDDGIEYSLRPAKRRLLSVRPRYETPTCIEDCVYPSQCYHEEREATGTLSPIVEEEEEEEEIDQGWYMCDNDTVLDEEWHVEEDIDEHYG